jgi:hypothetical protein
MKTITDSWIIFFTIWILQGYPLIRNNLSSVTRGLRPQQAQPRVTRTICRKKGSPVATQAKPYRSHQSDGPRLHRVQGNPLGFLVGNPVRTTGNPDKKVLKKIWETPVRDPLYSRRSMCAEGTGWPPWASPRRGNF